MFGTLLQILQLLVLYLVPFFIVKSIIDAPTLNYLKSVVTSTYVNLIGTYVVIPGAAGGIEYAFITLFSNFVKKPFVLSSTILWRFVTYYFPVILGGIMFNMKRKDIDLDELDK